MVIPQRTPKPQASGVHILDDQSNTTFIAKETLCQLGVRGHQTQLLLSTMHRKDAAISCEKVNGLFIQDYRCQVTIALPNTFSVHTIPARREQIPRPEAALNWAHMKKMAGQLMPYRDDVEVGLLIGSNCTRTIVPREVTPGILDEPHALRTDLGWGIVGRVSRCPDYDGDVFGVTNRILPVKYQRVVFLLLYSQGTEDACSLSEPEPRKSSIPFRSMKCSN